MAHNVAMTTTTGTALAVRTRRRDAVRVGIALVVAELLLAVLWYPWVVDYVFFGPGVPYEVPRLLIVAPEYLLLAVAVHLVGLSRERRLLAVGCALLAGLVVWGVSVLESHLAPTPMDALRHHDLLTVLQNATLIVVPTLGALAWGVARRQGRLWLLGVAVAPVLHYWIQHTVSPLQAHSRLGFRVSEAHGMTLVILPVALAILAGWALEQVDAARSVRSPGAATYDEGPPPQG